MCMADLVYKLGKKLHSTSALFFFIVIDFVGKLLIEFSG